MQKIVSHRRVLINEDLPEDDLLKPENIELELKVRWLGYQSKDDTWETQSSLIDSNASEIVLQYLDELEAEKAKIKDRKAGIVPQDQPEKINYFKEIERIIEVAHEEASAPSGSKGRKRAADNTNGERKTRSRQHANATESDTQPVADGEVSAQGSEGEASGADTEDEGEIYHVDKLIDHRLDGDGNLFYLVRWKDFGEDDDTWEPFTSVAHSDALLTYNKILAANGTVEPRPKESRAKHSKQSSGGENLTEPADGDVPVKFTTPDRPS